MFLETLSSDVIAAQKEKDIFKVSVLRYLLSKIKDKEIDLRISGEPMTDEIALQVLKSQIKKQKKSIESFEQGGRKDLVEKEQKELEILEQYYSQFSNE